MQASLDSGSCVVDLRHRNQHIPINLETLSVLYNLKVLITFQASTDMLISALNKSVQALKLCICIVTFCQNDYASVY